MTLSTKQKKNNNNSTKMNKCVYLMNIEIIESQMTNACIYDDVFQNKKNSKYENSKYF